MNTNNNNPQESTNDLKCIWMASKLVEYKLCDMEFDCENCEFDKVFRNLSTKASESKSQNFSCSGDLLENAVKRIENENFDDKLIYLKKQLVLKNLFGNAYYLGINPVVMSLLEDVNSVREYAVSDVKKEQIIFTIAGSWGEKDFISPINFVTLGKISIQANKFRQSKWNYIVLFNNEEVKDIRLNKEDWIKEKKNTVSFLMNQMNNKPAIGESLMDGGENLQFLYQYLGHKNYLKLVNEFYQ